MPGTQATPPHRRLDELLAAARPPAVPSPPVVGGWVPDDDGDGSPGAPGGSDARPGAAPAPRRVRPAAAVAALVLALAVVVVTWVRSSSAGEVVDVPARAPSSSSAPAASAPPAPAASAPPSPAAPATVPSPSSAVVVDVEGRVRKPGLVRLTAGARVADAIEAAGGATSGAVLARLNLARVVADGEQVLVPGPGDALPPAAGGSSGVPGGISGAPGGAAGGGAGAVVDLNAATVGALDALPGVGPVLAARIVGWRTEHGRFTTVDELGEVPGIGPKVLERLRPLVRV